MKDSDSGGISSRTSTGWVRREHSICPLPRSKERTGGRRLSVHLLGPHNDPGCLSRFLRAQRSCYSRDTPSLAVAAKATPAATNTDGPGAGGDLEAPGWGAARRQSGDTGKDQQTQTPAPAREGTGPSGTHRPPAPGWRRSARLSRQVPSLRFPVPLQPRRGGCGRR